MIFHESFSDTKRIKYIKHMESMIRMVNLLSLNLNVTCRELSRNCMTLGNILISAEDKDSIPYSHTSHIYNI